MRLPIFCLAALGVAACMNHASPVDKSIESTFPFATAKAAAPPPQLHVVTFNTHMEPGEKIAGALANDKATRGADVIILEEVHREGPGCSGACAVAKALGMYSVYAPGHVNGKGTDGVAVLARVPITASDVIELPHYNVVVNGGRRIALVAKLAPMAPGQQPITVYGVHLENRLTVKQRRHQMAPIVERAERESGPVIIAGDLNTSPFTWLCHLIPILTTTQDDRMEEFVRGHGFQTPVAESGPTSRFLAMKLDAIYTRGFATRAFATADASNVSDHLALWAKLVPL
jgi:endonuclease/exonuclease/phosphatase family metal-dependent hydrolase